jgi:hypothetical protein
MYPALTVQCQYLYTALNKGMLLSLLSLSGTLESLWSAYRNPLSVRLFVWSISRTAVRIFMKFYFGRLCCNVICVHSFGAYRKAVTDALDEDLRSFVSSFLAHLPRKWNICPNETFSREMEHMFYVRYTSSRMTVDKIKRNEGGATDLLHVSTFRDLLTVFQKSSICNCIDNFNFNLFHIP